MNEPKRILILTEEMGFGHLSASKAIASALDELYGSQCVVKIANLMDDQRSPAVFRQGPEVYDRLVRENPDLYKFNYQLSDNPLYSTIMGGAMTVLILDTLNKAINEFQPDVIVVTRETYLAPLSGLFQLNRLFTSDKQRIPVITAITDLTTVHHMWFDAVSDYVLVPTPIAYDLAIQSGLPEAKVKITGVPINPEFVRDTPSRDELRASLGWQPDLVTLLVVAGKRVRRLDDVLSTLNHSGLPLQLAIVAGGDHEFYEALRDVEWHVPTHLYDFVDTLPHMMRAADCIACKAGGLIISESLACRLPILLIDRIEGQESGNADYVIQEGAGDLALTPLEALEAIFHWLAQDRKLLAARRQRAQQIGQPRAAYEAAELIWATSESAT